MKPSIVLTMAAVAVAAMATLVAEGQQNQKPTVKIPESGVPQIMTIEGDFIRVAYNNEGYVTIGYRIANASVGEEWLMLEMGTTLRQGKPAYTLKRESISIETPDGTKIPMATNEAYLDVNLMALQNRAKVMHDSIDFFPPTVSRACRLGFFSDLGTRTRSYDQIELSWQAACVGRVFFKVPGGIKYGQHWLNVQFKDSLIRVPFRVFTKEEEKTLSKNYNDIRKQVQEAFSPKK